MKERWPRDEPPIALDIGALAGLLAPVFPGTAVTDFEPVAGGLINTNLKVTVAGHGPVLLRLYQREGWLARKEAAIAARIGAKVPVARFLHVGEPSPATPWSYAVVEWIEGPRLADIASSLAADDLAAVGRAVGRTLAAIHGFLFDRPGFLDDDFRVPEAIDLDREGLLK